ncbi:MAG: alpha/beta hydrolase [Rubrivivax sp.]|nr:alpha/beta hydrolase [Pyrinomonadaceae bacterium]
MFVKPYGAGAEVYLGLHGWGSDHRVFAPLLPSVPPRATFFSADLPGCASSPAPREWSADAIVAEVVEAISALKAQPVTVVGHCGGGVFGLLAAKKAEGIIKRVIMIDPFAYLPRYFRLFISENFGRHAYNTTFANPFGRWLTNQALSGRRESRTDLTASFSSTDHQVARRYLKLFDEMGGVQQFSGLRAGVDLVHGEKSFGAVRKSVGMFKDTLPHARTWQLKGAGHMPMTEATLQLSRIIFEPETAGITVQRNEQHPSLCGESGG